MKLVDDHLFARPSLQNDFVDEFTGLDIVANWAELSADSGAAASLATDGETAVILTTGGTNNNECYLVSNATYDVAAGQPLTIDFQQKHSEAATDDANIIMGLVSGATTDTLQDDGAGPPASYSGACFFKVDGGTTWNVETSVAGVQTTTATNITAGATAYQNFRIEIRPVSSTQAEVVFLHGDKGGNWFTQCKDTNGNPIKHTITYTSFAAAKLVIGVKAGGANSETPRWDRVRCSQVKP